MKHIFISHSHEDADFAENLQTQLTQAGINSWRDVSIEAGEDWRREIDQAIKDALTLIVVMTPSAKASEYVTYEWAFAWGTGIKVIPVLLKQTPLHPRLESLQYLDFTNRNARPFDNLIGLIRETESSKPPQEPAQVVRIGDSGEQEAYHRMIDALNDQRWSWRTVERLGYIGGVSEEKALEILRHDTNVEFNEGKGGLRIARIRPK